MAVFSLIYTHEKGSMNAVSYAFVAILDLGRRSSLKVE